MVDTGHGFLFPELSLETKALRKTTHWQIDRLSSQEIWLVFGGGVYVRIEGEGGVQWTPGLAPLTMCAPCTIPMGPSTTHTQPPLCREGPEQQRSWSWHRLTLSFQPCTTSRPPVPSKLCRLKTLPTWVIPRQDWRVGLSRDFLLLRPGPH